MPEREFELYLSLLGRFLRLKPVQHAEIADELRDHLEQRLEELAARGMTHDEAIHKALAEFGDAAELANHFTREKQIRRRKLIVRRTLGTVAALAASLLIATAFWPATPQAPLPARGVAQEGKRAAKVDRVVARFPAANEADARTEAKLTKAIDNLKLNGATLETALEHLGNDLGVDFLFDTPALEDLGVSPEEPIRKLTIKHTKLEARVALDLILEPLKLGYIIHDGLVTITAADKVNDRLSLRVYNVRDLLTPVVVEKIPVSPTSESPDLAARQAASTRVVLPGGSSSMGTLLRRPQFPDKQSALSEMIQACVDPESWDDVGGPCSIGESTHYDGLLFVYATETVHRKLKSFLDEMQDPLRAAIAAKGTGSVATPHR